MTAWHAEAKALREQGLTYREIGERLGKPLSTVAAAVNDNNTRRREQKRAWERDPANKPRCPRCGGPMAVTAKRPSRRAAKRCWSCRLVEAERFRQAVIDGYRSGRSPGEIADVTDRPVHSVRQCASDLRRAGVDLPYGLLTRPQSRAKRERGAA